jgi:hypothetical protein
MLVSSMFAPVNAKDSLCGVCAGAAVGISLGPLRFSGPDSVVAPLAGVAVRMVGTAHTPPAMTARLVVLTGSPGLG